MEIIKKLRSWKSRTEKYTEEDNSLDGFNSTTNTTDKTSAPEDSSIEAVQTKYRQKKGFKNKITKHKRAHNSEYLKVSLIIFLEEERKD